MTDLARPAATSAPGEAAAAAQFEPYRVELTGYCYRMLGSAFEAEDAVQETLVRAWRGIDRFEGRASLRSWLYRIATNVCLSLLRSPQRRAVPADLGPSSRGDATLGAARSDDTWLEPIADARALPPEAAGDPAELAVSRETIRLAFVAALQHLPPRQRAVLILRDVLRWRATEVADLLDTSVVSVKSALQRARATLAAAGPASTEPAGPVDDAEQQALLTRYVDAFERYDVEALVSLLHEDATVTMPPYSLWLQGREDIRRWWYGAGADCAGSILTPLPATNGAPAFAQYRPDATSGRYEPFAVAVLEVAGGRIVAINAFLGPRVLASFGLRTQDPRPV